jgi:hypothetical protein
MKTVELIERSVVGDAATVAATVARVRRSGRLVDMTLPRKLPDGRVLVVVKVRPPASQPAKSVRRSRISIAAAVGTAALGTGAFLVYAIAQLVEVAAAHLGWLVVLLLILCAAVFLRPNHRATCAGLHCPGCKG